MRPIQQPGPATPRDLNEADRAHELEALRVTCWRQAQEIHSLLDTVAILRAGANRLAADNAMVNAELAVTRGSRASSAHRQRGVEHAGRVRRQGPAGR